MSWARANGMIIGAPTPCTAAADHQAVREAIQTCPCHAIGEETED
ncbi:MAG TPA: hypothetical protein VFW65_05640 [Pseudonocardiaceae bacterium]|nr:hypothetical protein [Pseudonocardiaceae bacterium]